MNKDSKFQGTMSLNKKNMSVIERATEITDGGITGKRLKETINV